MGLSPGTRFGAYEIVGLIGIGGMGEVYRARDTALNRVAAIKVLLPEVANNPERISRFRREAQVLASLNHSGIAAIYGLEERTEGIGLVLEFVDGETLADRLSRGPLAIEEALAAARQIAAALEAAHDQGIVHRDLKPANVKLRPNGIVKLLDFGLAKLTQASDSDGALRAASHSPTRLTSPATQFGAILGTTEYMSPEQARGLAVDKTTDIWAFGCLLYEMLTGRPAFSGQTVSDTIARILEREPDWNELPPSTPGPIRELLRHCLKKDPRHRVPDMKHAALELDQVEVVRRPARRRSGLLVVAGVSVVVIALAGAWWYRRGPGPAVPHAPVSVLITDLHNNTNDPIFDRTLEPMLRMVLEGAGFISAYDRTRISGSLGVQPPERLDESSGREMAVKEGLGVILSSSLDRQGNGYKVSARAVQTVTGSVLSNVQGTAPDRDRVLSVATQLVTAIRKALGDNTSDSAQMFARATLSTTSLEVVRYYAAAQEASSNGKFEEARRNALKAVELDPDFGVGYQLLAVASRNMGRREDAEKYINEAMRHLDGMTDRERLSTRGMFFRLTGDYPQCVKEYGELIARYAADVIGHNQRALCLAELNDMAGAVNEMRRAVEILPKRVLFRINLALYAGFAGDFQTAERESRTVQEMGSQQWGLSALAAAQTGQGQIDEAIETYRQLARVEPVAPGAPGPSEAAAGLGDLANYEGRFAEAVRIFEAGARADLAANQDGAAAAKFAAVGYVEAVRGRVQAAVAAANKALINSSDASVRFAAASTLIAVGDLTGGRAVMAELSAGVPSKSRAHAKILEALIALKSDKSEDGIRLLTEANSLLDQWIGHFYLGRAYLESGQFAQADSEFDRCIRRRGELLSTDYGLLPPVYYYQGRAREGLKSVGFAESYRTYLRIRERAGEDPMLPDVRRRAGL
jgi:tetratricopeptide (TPR) repeat protein